jgi:glycosyltransferase involved in cell wall biosynthesis
MRILHIANHTKEVGNGIVNVMVDLAITQAKDGHQVAIITGGGSFDPLLTQNGVRLFTIDQGRSPKNLLRMVKLFKEAFEDFKPQIVHAHMMTGTVVAKLLKNRYQYKLVATVHNAFQRSSRLMGLADKVITVSKAVEETMRARGIASKKLVTIFNGTIGSPRTQSIESFQAAQLQKPAIVTVAGLYQRKGIQDLITAFLKIESQFPQANLYLVGDGPDRNLFETLAKNHGRIHFLGFQKSPQTYVLGADIFVLASHQDPCPLVLFEAREAGAAIIATDVDGIPEILEQGAAGTLIPAQNSDALATELSKLLASPELVIQQQQKAKNNLSFITVRRVVDEHLALYQSLLETN